MVIFIDAVPYTGGFDERGRWHQEKVGFLPPERRIDDPLNPARGVLWGVLASGVLWIGLIAAGRAILSLL